MPTPPHWSAMPEGTVNIGAVRYQNQGCLHFITFSCYHRMPLLDVLAAKETFETELE
ncbi:MAG TPA: hypothetical protein VMG82_13535 [Candidatus Sulfotelmatobacter sp.]|nr:hypothetical protein [Candidatus Sulfotelmatobacter sp.]